MLRNYNSWHKRSRKWLKGLIFMTITFISRDFNRKRSHESFTPILNDKISEQIINSLSLNV